MKTSLRMQAVSDALPELQLKKQRLPSLPTIVSLFCGAGGLDAGFRQGGFPIELALDCSAAAIKTHRRNFPGTRSVCVDLKTIGGKGVCDLLSETLPAGSRIG